MESCENKFNYSNPIIHQQPECQSKQSANHENNFFTGARNVMQFAKCLDQPGHIQVTHTAYKIFGRKLIAQRIIKRNEISF